MMTKRITPLQGMAMASMCLLLASTIVSAQPPGGPPGPPPTPRQAAQVDMEGYWVALVTEDWLWRMITPEKGDVTSVPVNPAGREAAMQWDRERDIAEGEQCRPFGAAGLMRMPLRLHITWEDDDTLRIDTDAGEQTRLLHFSAGDITNQENTWQGNSLAAWTRPMGFDLRVVFGGPPPPRGPLKAGLKVVTDHLRPGYLRKNGIPYSENTQLTEYFTRMSAAGNDYLTVLSVVHDPMYLNGDFVTSSHFKREADDANWAPSPCYTAPPRSAMEQTP